MVINYELPETTELLTHRVGRTGRMGREGDAVTLLMPSDESKWRQLQRSLRVRIPRKPWTGDLPAVPAAIEAFPLYPKREERRSRSERPDARRTRSAHPVRQRTARPPPHAAPSAAAPGAVGAADARAVRTAPAAAGAHRRRGPPHRSPGSLPLRCLARRGRTRSAMSRSSSASRRRRPPPASSRRSLSTQVGALLSRYQETGTVATPVDVPLTRRAPMRMRREERVVTEDANAAAQPESRSERARTFGRSACQRRRSMRLSPSDRDDRRDHEDRQGARVRLPAGWRGHRALLPSQRCQRCRLRFARRSRSPFASPPTQPRLAPGPSPARSNPSRPNEVLSTEC